MIICEDLLDKNEGLNTWLYCAPIFIANSAFGILLCDDNELIFEKNEDQSIRSGTLTFISYNGELFALTCKHVVDALEKRQNLWRTNEKKKYGFTPSIEGFYFFTPINNYQYHFNYNLTKVPQNEDGTQPDIAIARVNLHTISRLGRRPIELSYKNHLPETGIVSGYPEQQRSLKHGKRLNTFAPKFVTCVATLQVTSEGYLLVQDIIENNNELDSLSGISGGPIIWLNSNTFGFAGIAKEAKPVQPKEGGIMDKNSIWIFGEKITPNIFEKWVSQIPPLKELKDETKKIHIPNAVREEEQNNKRK